MIIKHITNEKWHKGAKDRAWVRVWISLTVAKVILLRRPNYTVFISLLHKFLFYYFSRNEVSKYQPNLLLITMFRNKYVGQCFSPNYCYFDFVFVKHSSLRQNTWHKQLKREKVLCWLKVSEVDWFHYFLWWWSGNIIVEECGGAGLLTSWMPGSWKTGWGHR